MTVTMLLVNTVVVRRHGIDHGLLDRWFERRGDGAGSMSAVSALLMAPWPERIRQS